jgi:hypothetical protein
MKVPLWALAGFIVVCVLMCAVYGQQTTPTATKAVALLSSPRLDVRSKAADEILAERQKTITELMAILSANSPDGNWLLDTTPPGLACRILGEMRASEAVSLLIKWVSPPAKGVLLASSANLDAKSPACAAIVMIGKPAEPALMAILKQEKGTFLWLTILDILKDIEGPKCAAVILEEAIAKEEADSPDKEHLQAALKKVKDEK